MNHTPHSLVLEQQNLYYLEFAFDGAGKLYGKKRTVLIFVFCQKLYSQTFSNVDTNQLLYFCLCIAQ